MTRSPLWREFESGDNILLRFLRFLILWGGFVCLIFAGILDLTWPQQAVLGLLLVLLGIWIDRSSTSYMVTLTLMLLSCFSTFRYGFWRISTVIKFFFHPGTNWTALDAFFIWLLVLAEFYAFTILFLGYPQTMWPLRRTPVPLPEDTELWPEVDLLIPTYNEPLSVVKYTALAAMNIDWPADKLNVYILDDGKREEFRAFAEDAGIGYMTRDDNAHAKAGNINRALKRLDAPFVAIFDSDHVPTRSFLQLTMGWFGRDAKLGLLQTPHHFYSPDPFERNLNQFRVIPNEGELFYGVVQDGNDFWNATFFCGSCAVLRRTALDEVGRHTGAGGVRHRRRAHQPAHADARLEHGIHQYSAGSRSGDGAVERTCEAAHPLGARHGADSAFGQSSVCAGIEWSATALLLQRDDALSVRAAAADLPDGAADLFDPRTYERAWILGGHLCVCIPALDAFSGDQLAHSGTASTLILERTVRNSIGALYLFADPAGADEPQAGASST